MVAAIILLGYLTVIGNKCWAKRHVEDRKATNIILVVILLLYSAIYAYLTFFYREQMTEIHIRLQPFWSYREAVEGFSIRRLGVARSILLNIAITIPLGYLLPAVYRFTKRRYLWTMITVLILSASTELIQYITRTGLAETDDLINNLTGGGIGAMGYWLACRICIRV